MEQDMDREDLHRLFGRVRREAGSRLSWATRITLVRILLLLPFVGLMLNTHDPQFSEREQTLLRYGAVAIFVLMAVTDAIDGYLARHRGQITRLGTFLDPLADKLLITSASLLLVSDRAYVDGFRLPVTVVVLIIGKDILVVIGFLLTYLITSQIHIVPVWAGKLATALQLVMVAAVLIAPELADVIPHFHWLISALWWSAGAAAVLAALIYIRNGTRYIEHYERTEEQEAGG